jgi:hypothetical protein
MRNEASLRRLTEMAIDVYVPRAASRGAAPVATAAVEAPPAPPVAAETPASAAATQAAVRVDALLLADGAAADALLRDVVRTLAFARISAVRGAASDEVALANAAALVMFGEAQARAAGAVLPAQRQRDMGWVVAGEPSALAGNAGAKRALWSELKRMVRGVHARQRDGA